jgi:hypothetical protein
MTTGHKCDHCKIGYFGGAAHGEPFCQACNCNGHGEMCDEVKGIILYSSMDREEFPSGTLK